MHTPDLSRQLLLSGDPVQSLIRLLLSMPRTITFSPDVSNWQSPFVENNISCLSTCTGPPVIRASRERPSLSNITRAQLSGFKQAGKKTQVYGWCYGTDVPEQMVQDTITLVDDLVGIKRLWFDIEDYQYFTKLPNTPTRILATLAAMGLIPNGASPAARPLLSQHDAAPAFSFASLPAPQAVAWLQAAVRETRRLGYIPGFYSAPGVWTDLTGGSTAFSDVDGWGADWDDDPDPSVLGKWGGIQHWIGKQYLGSGSNVSFCGSQFDLNVWFDELLDPAPIVVTQPSGQPDIPDTLDRLATSDMDIDDVVTTAIALLQQYQQKAKANNAGMRANLSV